MDDDRRYVEGLVHASGWGFKSPLRPRTDVRFGAEAGVVPGLVTGVLPGVVRLAGSVCSSALGVVANRAYPSTALE